MERGKESQQANPGDLSNIYVFATIVWCHYLTLVRQWTSSVTELQIEQNFMRHDSLIGIVPFCEEVLQNYLPSGTLRELPNSKNPSISQNISNFHKTRIKNMYFVWR
jgi:hypothetical protein